MYISIVKNTRQVPHNACVIFCLTRGYPKFQKFRYTKLILRNLHIKKAMKKYPLMLDNIIFHEGNISLFDRIFIKIFSFNWKIKFLKIDNFYEDTSFLGEFPSDAPLGYIMMCRFQYGKVWNILKRYDTLIRIDDDCFIYKIPTLEKNQFFACSGISSETHLDTNYSFPKFLQTLGLENFYDQKFPYTNLYISTNTFWQRRDVKEYLEKVLAESQSLKNRWGDLPVIGVALKAFGEWQIEDNLLQNFSYTHYSHRATVLNGTVNFESTRSRSILIKTIRDLF